SADDTSTEATPSPRGPSLTAGLWSYPLIAIAIALVGIVVAFVLVWATVVEHANDEHAAQLRETQLKLYASYFAVRTTALRHEIGVAANSEAAIAAFTSFDTAALAQAGRRLTTLVSNAARVDLIPKGKEALDLNSDTPINFVALDVIKRGQTSEFVGPE